MHNVTSPKLKMEKVAFDFVKFSTYREWVERYTYKVSNDLSHSEPETNAIPYIMHLQPGYACFAVSKIKKIVKTFVRKLYRYSHLRYYFSCGDYALEISMQLLLVFIDRLLCPCKVKPCKIS
jgi:hypothetical protein